MSVLQDQYLYDTYCGEVLPAREQHARIRQLATKLGVEEQQDACEGLAQRLCRATSPCDGLAWDSVNVQCGRNEPECVSARSEMQTWARQPRREHSFSPDDRAYVRRIAKQRGTPRQRAQLTCAERHGHQALCIKDPDCAMNQNGECVMQVSTTCRDTEVARRVLLDALLRRQPNLMELSGNARRRFVANIENMSEADICKVWDEFFPLPTKTPKGNAPRRLKALTAMVLSPEDTLEPETLQRWVRQLDIDLGVTAATFAAVFNAVSAAVSTQAPWWFYFLFYPTGREAFRDMLRGTTSGELLKLSLFLTGMKGNYLFNDIYGLFDTIQISENPYIQSLASTLSGILLRQIGNKTK